MITCYMCGMQFGTRSLTIHQRSCPTKRAADNKRYPKFARHGDIVKPDIPVPLRDDYKSIGRFRKAVETYNEAAYFCMEKGQPRCKCGRTMNPQSLMTHVKTCRSAKKGLTPEEEREASNERLRVKAARERERRKRAKAQGTKAPATGADPEAAEGAAAKGEHHAGTRQHQAVLVPARHLHQGLRRRQSLDPCRHRPGSRVVVAELAVGVVAAP